MAAFSIAEPRGGNARASARTFSGCGFHSTIPFDVAARNPPPRAMLYVPP